MNGTFIVVAVVLLLFFLVLTEVDAFLRVRVRVGCACSFLVCWRSNSSCHLDMGITPSWWLSASP